MSSENDLKDLYPFLHDKRQDAASLHAALLRSVKEKARESRRLLADDRGSAHAKEAAA
jgi:D-sedoheptulose 7-phosphate isomerase